MRKQQIIRPSIGIAVTLLAILVGILGWPHPAWAGCGLDMDCVFDDSAYSLASGIAGVIWDICRSVMLVTAIILLAQQMVAQWLVPSMTEVVATYGPPLIMILIVITVTVTVIVYLIAPILAALQFPIEIPRIGRILVYGIIAWAFVSSARESLLIGYTVIADGVVQGSGYIVSDEVVTPIMTFRDTPLDHMIPTPTVLYDSDSPVVCGNPALQTIRLHHNAVEFIDIGAAVALASLADIHCPTTSVPSAMTTGYPLPNGMAIPPYFGAPPSVTANPAERDVRVQRASAGVVRLTVAALLMATGLQEQIIRLIMIGGSVVIGGLVFGTVILSLVPYCDDVFLRTITRLFRTTITLLVLMVAIRIMALLTLSLLVAGVLFFLVVAPVLFVSNGLILFRSITIFRVSVSSVIDDMVVSVRSALAPTGVLEAIPSPAEDIAPTLGAAGTLTDLVATPIKNWWERRSEKGETESDTSEPSPTVEKAQSIESYRPEQITGANNVVQNLPSGGWNVRDTGDRRTITDIWNRLNDIRTRLETKPSISRREIDHLIERAEAEVTRFDRLADHASPKVRQSIELIRPGMAHLLASIYTAADERTVAMDTDARTMADRVVESWMSQHPRTPAEQRLLESLHQGWETFLNHVQQGSSVVPSSPQDILDVIDTVRQPAAVLQQNIADAVASRVIDLQEGNVVLTAMQQQIEALRQTLIRRLRSSSQPEPQAPSPTQEIETDHETVPLTEASDTQPPRIPSLIERDIGYTMLQWCQTMPATVVDPLMETVQRVEQAFLNYKQGTVTRDEVQQEVYKAIESIRSIAQRISNPTEYMCSLSERFIRLYEELARSIEVYGDRYFTDGIMGLDGAYDGETDASEIPPSASTGDTSLDDEDDGTLPVWSDATGTGQPSEIAAHTDTDGGVIEGASTPISVSDLPPAPAVPGTGQPSEIAAHTDTDGGAGKPVKGGGLSSPSSSTRNLRSPMPDVIPSGEGSSQINRPGGSPSGRGRDIPDRDAPAAWGAEGDGDRSQNNREALLKRVMAVLPLDPAYASLHAQTIRAIRQGTVQDMRAVIEQWQRVEEDVPHARRVLPLLSEGLVDDRSSQNM